MESFEICQQEMNTALQRMNERLGVVGRLDEAVTSQLNGLKDSCDAVLESTRENFQVIYDQLRAKQEQIEGQIRDFQNSVGKDLTEK